MKIQVGGGPCKKHPNSMLIGSGDDHILLCFNCTVEFLARNLENFDKRGENVTTKKH